MCFFNNSQKIAEAFYNMENTRVLIIRLSGIGDVITSLPILTEKNKNDHITWIVGKDSKVLLEASKLVETMITVDEKQLLYGTKSQQIKQVLHVWKHLIGKKFDRVVILHSDPRYHILCWVVKKRALFSFSKNPLKKGVYKGFQYLSLFNETILPDKLKWPELFLPSYPLRSVYDIVLAPGGNPTVEPGKQLRAWPISYYQKIYQDLINNGWRVAILGGPFDKWLENYFPKESVITNLGLLDSLAFLKESRLCITHDSGPMHMAILSKISVIAIFGPTIPKETVPELDSIYVLWGGEELPCRPCYHGKFYADCLNPLCMKTVTPEQVLKKVMEIL